MEHYEKYKNSNIEWLGLIPDSWSLKRAKDIAHITRGAILRPVDDPNYFDDKGQWLYLNISDVTGGNKYLYDAKLRLSKLGSTRSARVYANNVIITASATIGIPFINKVNVCIHDGFIPFTKSKLNIEFLFYYLMNENIYSALGKSNTQKNIYLDEAKNIAFAFPPLTEQIQIATFLDTKTQAIDKKINLLTTKIEYYKELRKTIINNAIYQGIPNSKSKPKLKNSDVSYVNQLNANWNLVRVKDLFIIGRGRVIGQDLLVDNGRYPVYSSQTENNGCLGYIETYDFNSDMLTWTTDGANAGTVFRRSGKFNCTNVCGTLLPIRKNLDLNYMVYALQVSAKHNKRIDTNGAKIMNNEMAVIQIPFPTKTEQTEIANYLDIKISTIDKITTNLQSQIETLKELRKTLINDVVTGKIKVIKD
jgi:type I restriction enzyme S subunit